MVDKLEGKRKNFLDAFKVNGIEVRPIVTGNFVKNKAINFFDYSIHGTLDNADYIHENGFFVGNNGKDLNSELKLLYSVVKNLISEII